MKCDICNKSYIKLSSYENHKILCEFKAKSKREQDSELQESEDTPDYDTLVKVVKDMSRKMSIMEEKINTMQQWINRKTQKLNIISWLSANYIPIIGYKEWYASIIVTQNHCTYLMTNNLYHTIQLIFEDNIDINGEFKYPIYSYVQKNNAIFIYDNDNDTTDKKWKKMETNDMLKILNFIQKQLLKRLQEWKLDNKQLCDNDDNVSISWNKTIVKLMVDFDKDGYTNRIRNTLYNYIKKDVFV